MSRPPVYGVASQVRGLLIVAGPRGSVVYKTGASAPQPS